MAAPKRARKLAAALGTAPLMLVSLEVDEEDEPVSEAVAEVLEYVAVALVALLPETAALPLPS